MAVTASYKAPPSMLSVAPTGSTNLVTFGLILLFFSIQVIVTGKVAALKMMRINENIRYYYLKMLQYPSKKLGNSVYKFSQQNIP